MKHQLVICSFVSVLIGGVLPAHADLIGVAGGAGNPGATLGPYTMTPFAIDTGARLSTASSLDSPLGGSLGFSLELTRYPVSVLEAYWSGTPANNYTGMTYHSDGSDGVTLTMPSNTVAFYLYVVPNSYAIPESITVTAQDGTSVTQTAQADLTGALNFGFYATGGDLITSLTVTDTYTENFYIGQFGIAATAAAAPEPSSLTVVLLCSACLAVVQWTKRHRRAASGTQASPTAPS